MSFPLHPFHSSLLKSEQSSLADETFTCSFTLIYANATMNPIPDYRTRINMDSLETFIGLFLFPSTPVSRAQLRLLQFVRNQSTLMCSELHSSWPHSISLCFVYELLIFPSVPQNLPQKGRSTDGNIMLIA